MKLYKVFPPTCGEFGPETQINYNTIPYSISNVQYIIDHWPDDLITSHPVFMANQALAEELVARGCTGFSTELCKLEKSCSYSDNDSTIGDELPEFVRLLINDSSSANDILTKEFDLVVTERVRDIVIQFNCRNVVFEELE